MSNIEWTDETWNPVIGCSIVSSGCSNCYAMTHARRMEHIGVPVYKGLTKIVNNRPVWTNQVRCIDKALTRPLAWKSPKRVFVNSMSDLFHEDVPNEFILKVWEIMRKTPQHVYQILTKRPERLKRVYSLIPCYVPNVWIGVSVENAETAHRIESLLEYWPSGFVKFVSFEPLIGSVGNIDLTGIDWAIVGGESGKGARPMKPEWVGEVLEASKASGTAFFFKQWGAFGEDGVKRKKHLNGREYQGRTWDQSPVTPQTIIMEYGKKQEIEAVQTEMPW